MFRRARLTGPGCRMLLALVLPALLGAAGAPPEKSYRDDKRLPVSESRFAVPPQEAAATDSDAVVLMFTGDSKLCGRTANQIRQHGEDYPFALVCDILRSADLAYGNCETAITNHPVQCAGKPAGAVASGKAFVFKSDPGYSGRIFSNAGLDVLQLANNHAMDYCGQGLLDTCTVLDEAKVSHVGGGKDSASAARPIICECKGLRIGILAYSLIVPPGSRAGSNTPGINTLPADYAKALQSDIGALKKEADFVVVGFHWGIESKTAPDRKQISIGRAAVDAGASLVIGSHPHTLQGVEFYHGGVIAYSLGNFVFTGASAVLPGCILRVTVDRPEGQSQAGIGEVALLPCWIRNGRPEPSADAKLLKAIQGILSKTECEATAWKNGWSLLRRTGE